MRGGEIKTNPNLGAYCDIVPQQTIAERTGLVRYTEELEYQSDISLLRCGCSYCSLRQGGTRLRA
ncbi:hypothetical protein BDW72DRAFT_183842 [Aspergillus terricola var. indicus]